MTTPRRPLTPAQLLQRRRASQRAAEVRRERGLTEAELAQRRAASQRAVEARGRQRVATSQRAEAFKAERASRDWKIINRELTGEAKDLMDQFRASQRLDQDIRDQRDDANLRALVHRGLDRRWAEEHGLNLVAWDNRALQSFLRKWDNLARKGWTRERIERDLARRLSIVQAIRGENLRPERLLDLVREFYGQDVKGRRLRSSHLKVKPWQLRGARRIA